MDGAHNEDEWLWRNIRLDRNLKMGGKYRVDTKRIINMCGIFGGQRNDCQMVLVRLGFKNTEGFYNPSDTLSLFAG
jgi:hypothetical protein